MFPPERFFLFCVELRLVANQELTGPVFEEEIHGPHPIQIQESDGFGPPGE